MVRISRRAAGVGLAASALVGLSRPARAADKVVVYTVIPETEINRQINDEFTKRTGIEVVLLVIPAVGTAASRIRSEKDRPRADVFAAAPVDFQEALASDGLLESYKSPLATPEVIAKGYADPKGFWTGWYAQSTAIVWNTERLAKDFTPKGIAPPKSWEDLLKPEYAGQIVTADTRTSSMGVVLLATQIFRSNEDNAWAYIRALNKNIKLYTPSATLTVTMVERGEATFGIFFLGDVLAAKVNRQQPIDLVVPQDNTANVWTASVIKGGPNTEAGKKYIDFLQSEYAQEVNARLGFRYPLNPKAKSVEGAPPLSEIKLVNYDNAFVSSNLDRLRKRWAVETGQ
jgi:iron(III) transport system substrate-binding protein